MDFIINTAQAAVTLPTFNQPDLPAFISSIYSFSLTVVGIAVFIRILYAGFLWLTAAGNASKAGDAKKKITDAVVGTILLFAAYLILYIINPDLVKNTFEFNIPKTTPASQNVGTVPATTSGNGSVAGTPNDSESSSFLLPAANAQIGTYFFTVRVLDANGDSFDQGYNMEVLPSGIVGSVTKQKAELAGQAHYKTGIVRAAGEDPLTIVTRSIPDGTVGMPYYAEIIVNGGTPPYAYILVDDGTASGLPNGLYVLTAIQGRQLAGRSGGDIAATPVTGDDPPGGDPTLIPGVDNFVACEENLFCEDRKTGERYKGGPNGCQGEGYTGPAGTRQVMECKEPDSLTSCGGVSADKLFFYWRNCNAQLSSIRIGKTNNFDSSKLPSAPGEPGTLFAVDANFFAGGKPVKTIGCSYGAEIQAEAVRCGLPASGEYCLPGYTPTGCVNPK